MTSPAPETPTGRAQEKEEEEEKKNAYRILVGKSEGKRPLGRPRCRYVDNNEMLSELLCPVIEASSF
jgi:hypothetical protein